MDIITYRIKLYNGIIINYGTLDEAKRQALYYGIHIVEVIYILDNNEPFIGAMDIYI